MSPNQDDDERQQRLAAIAELEQQHKQRRSVMTENEQIDPFSNRSGKYFILLVSKGSGNLEQRANQDRAETILNEYPHEILDGSNFSLTNKRDELFAISKMRGNYPQLFLVDHGATTFVGDFNIVDRRNDEGTLWALLEETQLKLKKKKSIVTSVKSLLKSGSSTRKLVKDDIGNHASSRGATTDSFLTRSTGHIDSEWPSSTIIESVESGEPEAHSNKPGRKRHTMASSFGHLTKSHFVLEEEEEDLALKPASTGQLIFSRSEGNMPLSDDHELKSKGRRRSNSHGRSKDLKHSASKGHASANAKETNEKGESKVDEKPRKSSAKSTKSRSRSEIGENDEDHKDGELEGKGTKPRKHRSTSRSRLSESMRSSRHGEEHEVRRSSRSRSQGRLRDSAKGSNHGEKSPAAESEENGEMNLKEEESATTSTRSKSLSKRNMRSVDSEGNEGEEEEGNGIQAKPRKPRSKGLLMTYDDEDHVSSTDGTMKPKSKTRLREQDGEKHPTGRRRSGQSASPHKLREKTIVRSNSPGTYRGGIARKREAMKEFRERRSVRTIDPVDLSPGTGVKPRKHSSVGSINVGTLSPLNSPRRHQSLLNVQRGEKDSDEIDESLHELVRRVKEKEKKRQN